MTAFCFDPSRPLSAARFDQPWAARLFGVTMALSEKGLFSLRDFQAALTAAVATREQTAPIEDEEAYYSCWLQALSALLSQAGVLEDDALSQTEIVVAERLLELQRHRHDHAAPREIAPVVTA